MTTGLIICLLLLFLLLTLSFALVAWYFLPRRFSGWKSVANAYDRWTQDQLLERLWGEHIHLGYYACCYYFYC